MIKWTGQTWEKLEKDSAKYLVNKAEGERTTLSYEKI
jgi:TfoX/Sxy family transcriptional regulator of competence genes